MVIDFGLLSLSWSLQIPNIIACSLIFVLLCSYFQEGAIALHEASKQGHIQTVKALLAKGSHVDVVNKVIIELVWMMIILYNKIQSFCVSFCVYVCLE